MVVMVCTVVSFITLDFLVIHLRMVMKNTTTNEMVKYKIAKDKLANESNILKEIIVQCEQWKPKTNQQES